MQLTDFSCLDRVKHGDDAGGSQKKQSVWLINCDVNIALTRMRLQDPYMVTITITAVRVP